MTQPPSGWEPPPGPEPEPPLGWQQPPPGWQPYPGGWQPPPQNTTGVVVALAFTGTFTYMMFNLILGFAVLAVGAESGGAAAVAVGALILVLVAFGGGGGLIAMKKPWSKGLGMGLMIGWALTSILTVGFCTGVNPVLYEGL